MEKVSVSVPKTVTRSASQPFFAKAGGGDFFAPARQHLPSQVQAKLTVNQPGDKLEQEADRMADKVVRMPTPEQKTGAGGKINLWPEGRIQKATLPEEKVQKAALPEEKVQKATLPEEKVQKSTLPEEKVQKATLPEEKVQKATLPEEKVQKATLPEEKVQKATLPEEKVQKKEIDGYSSVTAATQSAIRNNTGGGQPLSEDVRRYMEPRFKADFSNVRVHTDSESANLNNHLSARAFTYKNHVFFSRDQYQPATSEGRHLLAHELTHTLQQGSSHLQKSTDGNTLTNGNLFRKTNETGSRMYLTREGKLVELPPDMTEHEAASLENEARAAVKKLGKSRPSEPLTNVKKLSIIEGKKGKPSSATTGKKELAGKKSKKTTPLNVVSAGLKAAGTSIVAVFLATKGLPALFKGTNKLQMLRQNEQTHDTATDKLNQSEKAVAIPPSEGQSKSNAGQVDMLSSHPTPVTNENKAKQKLQDSIKENIPQKIEEVDNFKRDKKAQQMNAGVMQVVQGDKNAVTATFNDIGQTPAPTLPEHSPEALPPEELAPPTANLNLGQDAIASLQQEHTDVNNFTKEADNKLAEEGVSQEQLDMVDAGDLAEANKEKKGLEKNAKTEPLAVNTFARLQSGKVDNELKQEEKKERDGLKTKRKADLNSTAQKQKGTKSALEKKREEVAVKINGIYTKAQSNVKKKLADLETLSMKRFDDGNTKAAKEFEDRVNSELSVFKAKRYSGFWGDLKKAKDWLLGMDDLPEVKAIFDRNRAIFVSTINKLVEDISADNKRVIQECKDELANAKIEIREYVDKLGPGLKDIGQNAAKEMNAKLAELDQFINQKEQELQQKLKDKQQAAIKAIDEKIEKMKEAMSGALSKLGKLLLEAAKKFFTWALQKFGYSLQEIESIINKGAAVLKSIFTQPIKFVKNLINAALTGFKNFGKNFLTHLKNALFEWLTGSLEGLVLPQTWDFKGIVSVALQMIGISYQNIRKHMVTVMGETAVTALEKTFTLVKTLVTEGPMAAWEQLKEMAQDMKEAFIEAVKDFIKIKIIEQAIQWLIGIFIPGAGIIKAIIGIYDTIVFFIQKAKQIAQMVSSFLGSVAEIAAGNIGAAADALEKGLARGLTLVISFMAQLLHLTGITNKIKNAILKIRNKVDTVLAKVAKWIAEKAGKLIGKAKAGVGKLVEWWKLKKVIDNNGKKCTVYTEGNEQSTKLLIASSPGVPWTEYLKTIKPTDAQQSNYQRASELAKKIEQKSTDDKEVHAKNMQLWFNELSEKIKILNGDKETPASIIKFGGINSQGGAVFAEASILSTIHPPGSKPGDNADIWANLDSLGAGLNKPVRKNWYVQGHLLNENLGGPGLSFNLTPITKKANNDHKAIVENSLKKFVNTDKKVIYYKVKTLAPPPKGKNHRLIELNKKAQLTNKESLELNSLKSIQKLTAGFECKAYLLEKDDSGKWTKLGKALEKATVVIDNNIESDGKTYGYQ